MVRGLLGSQNTAPRMESNPLPAVVVYEYDNDDDDDDLLSHNSNNLKDNRPGLEFESETNLLEPRTSAEKPIYSLHWSTPSLSRYTRLFSCSGLSFRFLSGFHPIAKPFPLYILYNNKKYQTDKIVRINAESLQNLNP